MMALCMYDIIANWDTIGRSLTEEKPSKEFKTSLKTLQNKYAAPFPKTFLCATYYFHYYHMVKDSTYGICLIFV